MLPGEPGIYHQGPRPPVEQLAPVLAPVHPPAVQVKYNDIPLENYKDTAIAGCIFVFLLLLSAKNSIVCVDVLLICPYYTIKFQIDISLT